MQKEIKGFVVILTALVVVMVMFVPALAANEVNFLVSPVLPQNQRADTRGYFDLIVSPGQKQELDMEVTNRSDKDITVEVEVITASTNLNGVVNYSTQGKNDETLPYSVADLVTIEQPVVTIPANATKTVTALVEMPQEEYDGYLLGSIHVKKQLTDEELASGQMIINQYSYVVAVKLAENDREVTPDFALGAVDAELVNGRASIVNQIINPQPLLVKEMSTTVKILPKGSDTPIMARTMEKTDMAPNSIFPLTLVDDAGYGVKAGTYLSVVEIEHKGQTWSFEKEFEIRAEQAMAINSNAVNQETRQSIAPSGMPLWAVIAITVGLVLFVIIIVLLIFMIRRLGVAKREQ